MCDPNIVIDIELGSKIFELLRPFPGRHIRKEKAVNFNPSVTGKGRREEIESS